MVKAVLAFEIYSQGLSAIFAKWSGTGEYDKDCKSLGAVLAVEKDEVE